MTNPPREMNNWQKTSLVPKLSQLFFSTDGHFHSRYEIFGRGGGGSNRLALLCLGLLNVVLLIVAVVLGNNCAKVREGSLQVSHSAAAQLIDELNYLRSNHSDVIEAKEEAKNALDRALKNHTQLKEKIEQQQAINANYQRQVEVLHTEKTNLQSNISALEGNCGKCLPGWISLNSSCYFISYFESTTVMNTWPESRADCIHRGADLIVIDNPMEQKFMSYTIKNTQSGQFFWHNGFWLGLTDRKTKGTWVWINNVTEVEQRYWIDGEPNGQPGEDCAMMVYSQNNPWKTRYDSMCDHRKAHWICEMASR